MSTLSIGKIYQLYTTYQTLYNVKVKILGILSYEQSQKVSYDMNVLAINEKVISVSDDDLESIIENAGNNIYHCRSTVANTDGSYDEYIVWDGIIDSERTTQIDTEYTYTMTLKLSAETTTSMTQIISAIETFLQSNYGSILTYGITDDGAVDTSSAATISTLNQQLEDCKLVLNALNSLSNTIIPAANKLASTDLVALIDTINSNIVSINSSIADISSNIR